MVGSNTTLGSHATIWTRPERGLLQRGASKEKAANTVFGGHKHRAMRGNKDFMGMPQNPQKTIGDPYELLDMGTRSFP